MKLFLSVGFLLLCISTFSQTVSGVITNETKDELSFVNVLLFNSADTSMAGAELSDSTGRFSLRLPNNETEYYLEYQMIGYEVLQSEKFIGSKSFGTITLLADNQIDEVSITVQKPMFEQTGRGMIVNVEASPVLSTGSTQDVLSKIPGIVMNQDGSLTLKGKHNVVIYMDGKPTNMDQKDLVLFLQNTPANEIEKIEVFETPPAKFDAAGNAGIINIIRKKGSGLGFTGSAGMNAGYGNFHKFSPWLYGNYRSKKFNVYGSTWYYNSKMDHYGTGDMQMEINGETSSFYNSGHRIMNPVGYGGRYGIDYYIGKKNTIGYLGMLYQGESAGNEPSTVAVTGPAKSNYDFIDAEAKFRYYWFGHTHNFNFRRDIAAGESLNIDVDYIDRGSGNENSTANNFFKQDTATNSNYVEQEGTTATKIAVAKLDYQKTVFDDWNMETGLKSSWVQTKNKFLSYTGTGENDLTLDQNASNDFNYDEGIYSGYLVFSKKWEKNWSVDIGARVEHTEAEGYSPTLDSTFNRSYTSVFPNVAIVYSVDNKYSLSASATRRIQRPNYYELNPFSTQTNQFNFHNGNPFLNPQFTDVINLSWSIKNAIFFTASASQTLGQMTQVIDQQEDSERQVHTTRNMDDFYNYSFNASFPILPTKWWTMHWNATLYHNKLNSNIEFGNVGYEITSFNLNMQNTFILPKDYKLELRGFYNHDSYWNIYFVEPHYQLDLGGSKSFGNWRISLTLHDFLNIREGNGGVFQNRIKMPTTYKPESRKLMMSVFYKFGNHKVKGERKRKTGSEDILERTNN